MHDVILTSDDGNYRVAAHPDESPESPRWGAEFGVMVCGHRRYVLGDPHVGLAGQVADTFGTVGLTAAIQALVRDHGTTVILPLYLTDHSGLGISAGSNLLSDGPHEHRYSGDWDTSFVGAIFDTAERRGGEGTGILGISVEDLLRQEVREYDLYLRGEVYTLVVEQKVTVYTETRATYPDGTVESTDKTEVRWESYPDAGVTTALGDTEFGSIAADMLNEILVAQAGV